MSSFSKQRIENEAVDLAAAVPVLDALDPETAGRILEELASVFAGSDGANKSAESPLPNLEAKYRALLEQLPAIVFMAYLDRGRGEAYVSPHIEALLGYSQEEWLEDPVQWYRHIHPDDKNRWSTEAAEMFLNGKQLRSAYRVIARDGRAIWFQCQAQMMRREDGRPWFIHGVAFDITDLKQTEAQLQEERNLASAVLDTVGALVVVLDPYGRIIRFNRACEQITRYSLDEVLRKRLWDLFMTPEEAERFKTTFEQLRKDQLPREFESYWTTRDGGRRLIAWSSTVLPGPKKTPSYIIVSGTDITDRKRLEKAVLEISGREQRRIGQDLHDGLGQHLTGIAFMTKVQEQRLKEKHLPESEDAAKIVRLVNDAIDKTRVLSRGLSPVMADARGLMSALELYANEVSSVFGIACIYKCENSVFVQDLAIATHLYHIAQEAVNNAIKHGHAKKIEIFLSQHDGRGILSIKDDGVGFLTPPANRPGMGLHIMNYRAGMAGGTLQVHRDTDTGAVVTCLFPVREQVS